MNQHRRLRTDQGLTLIELLIVIVILGILSAIIVFSVQGITDRGQAASCESSAQTVRVAAEAYFAKYGSYPATLDDLEGEFLHDTPALTGNSFTVSGGYVISLAANTGVVTDNCPAPGSAGTPGGGSVCAFASLTPDPISVNGGGNLNGFPVTETLTLTGDCSAITAISINVDKNGNGTYGGPGEQLGSMSNQGGGVWTVALINGNWPNGGSVTFQIIVTGGSLGTFTHVVATS